MIIVVMSYNGREICFSASNEDEAKEILAFELTKMVHGEDEAKKAFPGGVVIRTLDADEAYSYQIEEAVYRAKEHKYRLEDALRHCNECFEEVYFEDEDAYSFDEADLENLVKEFEENMDCNLDENSVWNDVIKRYFQE